MVAEQYRVEARVTKSSRLSGRDIELEEHESQTRFHGFTTFTMTYKRSICGFFMFKTSVDVGHYLGDAPIERLPTVCTDRQMNPLPSFNLSQYFHALFWKLSSIYIVALMSHIPGFDI
jgi:hypothetical protein